MSNSYTNDEENVKQLEKKFPLYFENSAIIPTLEGIKLDTILFEGQYPILFTCVKENDVYLFICCLSDANGMKWIGTKTKYDNLIQLLENRITVRDAFLKNKTEKILLIYNGKNVLYESFETEKFPSIYLPTAGEYMDVDENEFLEEIAEFRLRNENTVVSRELLPYD